MEPSDKDIAFRKKERSYQETMNYINSRTKKYDSAHENFIVPWQLVERKKKEFNF